MTEQTGLREVLTIEQYQQAKHSGKILGPDTLVLVPASLLSEMQDRSGQPAQSDIVEMTYVGPYTSVKLWRVRQGEETLATLKYQIRTRRIELGDIRLSFDEAISILEREHCIQKTPTELKAEEALYQKALQNIEREPGAYVLPEIARGWYEQQIERIRQLLQAHSS